MKVKWLSYQGVILFISEEGINDDTTEVKASTTTEENSTMMTW
jgi:hypothetical protein